MLVDTEATIAGILRSHEEWLENPAQGTRADLSGLTFNEIRLRGANLRKALLAGVTMLDADLVEANLSGANMDRADLQRSNLAGADLTGTDLANAHFAGGWMAGVLLAEAKASFSNFRRAMLKGAKFQDFAATDSN